MVDPFEELLMQCSAALGTHLRVDHRRACTLRVREIWDLQMQLDESQEFVLLGASIAFLPPGKFRENVLVEALKANDQLETLPAILAYRLSENSLVAIQRYRFDSLDGRLLAIHIGSFIEYVEMWKEAIERGHSGPSLKQETSVMPRPFGL